MLPFITYNESINRTVLTTHINTFNISANCKHPYHPQFYACSLSIYSYGIISISVNAATLIQIKGGFLCNLYTRELQPQKFEGVYICFFQYK